MLVDLVVCVCCFDYCVFVGDLVCLYWDVYGVVYFVEYVEECYCWFYYDDVGVFGFIDDSFVYVFVLVVWVELICVVVVC